MMRIDSPTPVRRDSEPGRRRTVFPKAVQRSTKLSQSSTSCSLPSVANTAESKDTESAIVDPESSEKDGQGNSTLKRTVSTYSEQSSSNEVSLRRGEVLSCVRYMHPKEHPPEFEPGASPVVCIGDPSTSKDSETSAPQKNYVKCSNVIVGFAPVKKKKPYFAVLSKRGFELHESEKSFKKGVTAKHIVDLATAFNVHNDHYDPKLKKCLCLMGPDETIVIRAETKELTDEWYEAILQSLLPSRQLKLGRPCYPYEIFEAVFDVEVVPYMKKAESYKKSRKEAGYQNICEQLRDLAGPKRLCFYSHTVVLANRRIEPTTLGCPDSGFPPFPADAIVEFPRQLIAFFGVQERYFFLRLGRGIVLGNTELLIQCETQDMANAIHTKMYHIIEREAGRRVNMTMPNTQQGRHRDRAHTLHDSCQNCQNCSCDKTYRSEPFPGMESLSVPSPHLQHRNKLSLDSTPILSVKDRRLLLRDCLSFAHSVELDESAPSSPFGNNSRPRCSLGNFQIDHLTRLEQPRGSIHSLGGLLSDRPRRASNTIRLVKEEPGLQDAMRAARVPKKFSTQSERHDSDFGDPTRKFSARSEFNESVSDKGLNKKSKAASTNSLAKTGKSTSIYSTLVCGDTCCDDNSDNQEDSNPTARSLREKAMLGLPCSIDESYLNMNPSDWNYGQNAHLIVPIPYPPKEEKYHLEEVRSYVSDSSDSCYSSLANNSNAQLGQATLAALNAPRANSFGGRGINGEETVKRPLPAKKLRTFEKGKPEDGKEESSSNSLSIPAEDPRKRAFSLGSKNFFNFIGLNEFRRLVKKPLLSNRPASPNHTSTSGVSLNSSPASSSTNYLTSSEIHDDARISSFEANTFIIPTSGSFGSGRSSPFGRHTYPLPQVNQHDGHMEIDFSNLSVGRGSGSAGSIDSPNRNLRRDELAFAMPNFHLDRRDDKNLRPSEKIIQQHTRQQIQQQHKIQGDYVMTDPVATKYIGDLIASGFNPSKAEIKKELERHEKNRRMLEQQMLEKQQSQSRELEDFHGKASLCGLIVEEKEDTESNTDLDDRNSDTKTVIQSSSQCEPSTSTAHQN